MNSGIRILGVRGHAKTEQLQATAQCALKELNMNIPLVQYTEIEDFIRFKLSAIPAIILNGKIIFQKEIPEKEDLKIILKLLTMKNIIVPIDFSETSKNALHFAKDMTADLYPENTQIKVANVYNALFNTDNPLIIRDHKPVGEAVLKAIQSFMDSDVDIEKEENKVKEDLKVSAYPLFGTPVNKLEELSKDPKTKLIVMGTHGKNKINIERRIFGSIASEVSLKAHSPVLLIPTEVSYKRFKNIMIASDNLVPAEEHLHVLKTLIANEEASYHLVHVNKYEKEGINGLHTGKGQGRPPIVRIDNKSEVKKIEDLVEADPQNLKAVVSRVKENLGKEMSIKTLQRLLKKKLGMEAPDSYRD